MQLGSECRAENFVGHLKLSLILKLGWSLINEIVSYHVQKLWNINIHFAKI